jgi:CrcB protein
LARWGLGLWLSPGGVIPWGTLAANLIGGYLIGVCVAVFQAMPQLDPVWRLALVTGFLGALTTFSSFSAEVVSLLMQQRYALALGTASLHLLGSLVLTVAGIWSVQHMLSFQ